MIKIAVIDDQREFLDKEIKLLEDWFEAHAVEMMYKAYDNPLELVMDMEEDGKDYDLFFIDIEMPQMQGLELARIIRKYSWRSDIIFVTSHDEFSREGYETRAWRYIIKEQMDEEIPRAIDDLMKEWLSAKRESVMLEVAGGAERVYLDELEYLEVERKYVIYHRVGGKEPVRVRQSLKDAIGMLDQDTIVQINRYAVVNLLHLEGWREKTIRMRTGQKLDISRMHMKSFKEAFKQYMVRQAKTHKV